MIKGAGGPGAVALRSLLGLLRLGPAWVPGSQSGSEPEEWAVAAGVGLILVWILLAGETFTAFSCRH